LKWGFNDDEVKPQPYEQVKLLDDEEKQKYA
jgi:hypothetical protein